MPTILNIIVSIMISIIISIIVSIIISIIISVMVIVMNVKALFINLRTMSLIHTSSMDDIQNNLIRKRYNGRAVMTTMCICGYH